MDKKNRKKIPADSFFPVLDYLIRKALERKYNRPMELKALDDSEEKGANDYIYNRFVKKAE